MSVFENGHAEPTAVDVAIDASAILLKQWPDEPGHNFTAQGIGQSQ